MKKVLSGLVAGALLLSVTGVVFAALPTGVVQFSGVSSITTASSVSGENGQTGKGTLLIETGSSSATAGSLTAGNVNVGKSGNVLQGTMTGSATGASAVSGANAQTGAHHSSTSSQTIVTLGSTSKVGSATVGNVNFSFGK